MSNILDDVFFNISEYEPWTTRNAVEGIQIFGGIGSGKTSGSGSFFARNYLNRGFGGLVLTVKVDERDLWVNYCKQTGREKDLIIVEPDSLHRFNILDYETNRKDAGRGITANIVQIFKTVINAEKTISQGRTSNEPFWDDALDMFLFNVIDLCRLAYDEINFDLIYKVSTSLPDRVEKLKDADFVRNSAFAQALMVEITNKRKFGKLSASDFSLYQKVENYFINRHIPLSDKTRSIVEYSLEGLLFQLSRDPVYSLFCTGDSTFTPDDCLNRKIILLNLPVKVYDKVGRDIQIMFKYIWQRAMERRVITENSTPVFLWADEAQNFIHEHDIDYQATARSAQVCTVYLTQNLPNYLAHMGGESGRNHINSFLGTLGTKIFHANSDRDTNEYASKLIGEHFIEIEYESKTVGENTSINVNKQIQKEPFVQPESFIQLRTGTQINNFRVDGIAHFQRRRVNKGNYKPYLNMNFEQINK